MSMWRSLDQVRGIDGVEVDVARQVSPPLVRVWIDGDDEAETVLTPDAARELAALLIAAADSSRD